MNNNRFQEIHKSFLKIAKFVQVNISRNKLYICNLQIMCFKKIYDMFIIYEFDIPLCTPGDLHRKFALGLLHPNFCFGVGIYWGMSEGRETILAIFGIFILITRILTTDNNLGFIFALKFCTFLKKIDQTLNIMSEVIA